ncbi:ISL3 family transposase [Polymorphospora rubra]|uniref:ISL3 family transposase n=1 Tax=Polymorphospora rubra TaxID=338584 RepID=UPI001BB44A63|nr:ISL3 family transposase [Polymorphospora rubra]
MRGVRVWQRLLGVERAVVERVEWSEEGGDGGGFVVAHVRLHAGARSRCGVCRRRCVGYDRGEGRRRWRAPDLGTVRVVIEADAPRVSCRVHGVVVAAVPWARHGAGHTLAFDEMVAWLATVASKSAVRQLMRVAWSTVGAIVARVWADTGGAVDRFAGLTRIGIDEISYRRGEKYLTVVVDHDSGRLLWVHPGRHEATLNLFFDLLGPRRCAALRLVSADGAPWIARVVARRCPQAVRCADPFHVVAWAVDALDVVRRQAWNNAVGRVRGPAKGGPGGRGVSAELKRCRWALWKNPENLTQKQTAQLAWIARTDSRLHRAYLLKEGLRYAFTVKGQAGREAIDRWISWARRCRIPAFVDLSRRIVRHRDAIDAALDHGLSNALVESTNAKIRLIIRMAYGFRNIDALISMALLSLGGHRPTLPGRTRPPTLPQPTHG